MKKKSKIRDNRTKLSKLLGTSDSQIARFVNSKRFQLFSKGGQKSVRKTFANIVKLAKETPYSVQDIFFELYKDKVTEFQFESSKAKYSSEFVSSIPFGKIGFSLLLRQLESCSNTKNYSSIFSHEDLAYGRNDIKLSGITINIVDSDPDAIAVKKITKFFNLVLYKLRKFQQRDWLYVFKFTTAIILRSRLFYTYPDEDNSQHIHTYVGFSW